MARSVTQVCEDSLDHPELLQGCKLFVIALAKEFGYGDVVLGNADAIRGKFNSESETVRLADGREQATRGDYPYRFQGAAHAPYRIKARTQVDLVFPSALLKEVVYAYLKVPRT